jgi:tetratricopeptide (TPR) repeat protein
MPGSSLLIKSTKDISRAGAGWSQFETSVPDRGLLSRTSLAPKYFYVGYALRDLGDRTGDLRYFNEALQVSLKGYALYTELASTDPNPGRLRNVADGLADVGILRWKCCRDLTAALRDLQDSAQRFQGMADHDPLNLEGLRDVADVNEKLGVVLAEARRRSEALAAYRKALSIYEDLGHRDPTSRENAGHIKGVRAGIVAVEASSDHKIAADSKVGESPQIGSARDLRYAQERLALR